ncbi:hypothetical protein D1007_11348 [Hordeum vulgare]|nr:hypothetical protein D1007_11348 [Hordeum vulgare]
MADACRAHAKRHATRVPQTAPVGATNAYRPPSPVVNAATAPEVQEQQGSSQLVIEQADGHTATPSLVRASGFISRPAGGAAWPARASHGHRAAPLLARP